MLKPGWLRQGLTDAKREADARPELRDRVRDYPSGFICCAEPENQDDALWLEVLAYLYASPCSRGEVCS